ncbi:MAG: hypothetical protein WD050_02370 [Actinomycetota bacterium]
MAATEAEVHYRGTAPLGVEVRCSRTYAPLRICDEAGCSTVLSVYNGRDRCWVHAPAVFRAARGGRMAG